MIDNEAKEWLDGNELSYTIWDKKYRHNNESFEQWLNRVSGNTAASVRQLIKDKKFIFGGRILASRGVKDRKVTYSNCYVIPAPEDNLESIFKCASNLARTYSYGGGCGVDLSKLAPKGATIHNAAKSTSGAVSFMDFFSYVTGLIGQEGRRGALMLSLDCTHPDLIEFINLKTDLNVCTKANISVRVSDDFMTAVVEDKMWKLQYYRPESDETIEKEIKAREVLELLAIRNWEMAEPGILFWDNIKQYNMLNTTQSFEYQGVNPCGEEPLPAGGSCLLGSINLSEFVINPFYDDCHIDYDGLEEAVTIAVQALNQVLIEGEKLHPLRVQRYSVHDWRQIGLGTFGLGDMLIKLGIKYGSEQSLRVINTIFKCIAVTAVETSLQLAKVEGCYPACDKDALVESSFIKALNLPADVLNDIKTYGLFNSQLLTCAPTGSIGTMFNVSTGVEPVFALHYTRKTQSLEGKDTFHEVSAKIVTDYMKATGNKELPDYFIESKDIAPIDRIRVQAIIQKWVDASISSTINLPNEATVIDIYDIYVDAWKYGLKGVTVYRQGCEREGVLTLDNESKSSTTKVIPKRPKELPASCFSVKIKGQQFIVAVGLLDDKPYEIFAFKIVDYINIPYHEGVITKVKKGQYALKSEYFTIPNLVTEMGPEEQAVTLYCSMLMRHGIDMEYIRKTTKKVNGNITSFSSAICRILSVYIPKKASGTCPNCGGTLINEGGCNHCDSCEYSKCE